MVGKDRCSQGAIVPPSHNPQHVCDLLSQVDYTKSGASLDICMSQNAGTNFVSSKMQGRSQKIPFFSSAQERGRAAELSCAVLCKAAIRCA